MYKVYVLMSLTHQTLYVGSSEDVVKRLHEHNTGRCRYTSGRMPWKLVYHESCGSRSEAMQRERFFKSGQGRQELEEKLKHYSEIV